jgi:integrase
MPRNMSKAELQAEAARVAANSTTDTTTPEATTTTESPSAEVGESYLDYVEEGSKSPKSWPAAVEAGKRFHKWLTEQNIDLAVVRDLVPRPNSKPEFPFDLVAAYLRDCSKNKRTGGSCVSSTVEGYRTAILHFLRGTGWDTTAARKHSAAWVRRYDRSQPPRKKKKARPLLLADLKKVITYLDDLDPESLKRSSKRSELWRLRTRTAFLTQWFAGFRGSELVVHLRWEWLDLANSRINTPGGDVLKWQWGARSIPFEAHATDPQLDVHACLMELKAEYQKRGIRCRPGDRVFPIVVKNDVLIRRSDKKYGPAPEWWTSEVRDLLGEAEAALPAGLTTSEKMLELKPRQKLVYDDWLRDFKRCCTAAGFTPRTKGEKVATHSARRGTATQLHRNGTKPAGISVVMRHSSGASTPGYVEALHRDTSGLVATTAPQPPGVNTNGDLHQLLTTAIPERQEGCEVEHDGERCGKKLQARATVDGVSWACCEAHYRRAHYKGMTKAEFTNPIGRQPLPEGCEVEHDGVRCGKKTKARVTVDDISLACCQAHCGRAYNGKTTGEDFTNPIRAWTPRAKVKTL